MQIDWFSFTPIPSLLGGMILGVAAALYVLLHGRILGGGQDRDNAQQTINNTPRHVKQRQQLKNTTTARHD